MPAIKSPTQFDIGHAGVQSRAATGGRIVNHIVSSFLASHSYANVLANSLGSVALSNTDWSFSGTAGNTRVATIAQKSITVAAAYAGAASSAWSVLVDTVTSEWLYAQPVASSDVGPPWAVSGVLIRPAMVDNQTQPT